MKAAAAKRLTFATLEELHAVTSQTTAQQVLNGRIHHNAHGWVDVDIAPELRKQVIDSVVEIAGGHHATRAAIRRNLENGNPQHWALDRMHVDKYGDNPAEVRYCAGQDYTYEMGQLRAALK